MKGGESLGNEEGSEETSEEGSEEEVSPTRIYTPGVRPLTSGVFLCLQAAMALWGIGIGICVCGCLEAAVRSRGMVRGEGARAKSGIRMPRLHVPR